MQRGTIKVCNLRLSLGGTSVHVRTSTLREHTHARTHVRTHTHTRMPLVPGITENGSELSNFQDIGRRSDVASSRCCTGRNIQGGTRQENASVTGITFVSKRCGGYRV